jgi:uncharacterized SAM-binding protein YcdF (DUF218 family)
VTRGVASVLLALFGCAQRAPSLPLPAPALPPDAIVVLGHRPSLTKRGIGLEARARITQGVALYRAGRAPRILFSGGLTDEQLIEADLMAEAALADGVPQAAILRERASRDTIENARMSVASLKATLGLARAPKVLLVTSDYHSPRATHLFRCAGADVVAMPVALALTADERAARDRSERWVRLYYRFIDECKRAGGRRSHAD